MGTETDRQTERHRLVVELIMHLGSNLHPAELLPELGVRILAHGFIHANMQTSAWPKGHSVHGISKHEAQC